MNNAFKIALFYSAFTVTATTAIANNGMQQRQPMDMGKAKAAMMMRLDADKNGSVSKDEYLNHYETEFTNMDANQDGTVTEEEVLEASNKKTQEMEDKKNQQFNEMDKDGDGSVSKEEMMEFQQNRGKMGRNGPPSRF